MSIARRPNRQAWSGKATIQHANLYSDLVLHAMGPGLETTSDKETPAATSFAPAPLWGLGKRTFFLHDGRTKDLLEAIRAHASAASGTYPPSEANQVTTRFNGLTEIDKQQVLNFLRSL